MRASSLTLPLPRSRNGPIAQMLITIKMPLAPRCLKAISPHARTLSHDTYAEGSRCCGAIVRLFFWVSTARARELYLLNPPKTPAEAS